MVRVRRAAKREVIKASGCRGAADVVWREKSNYSAPMDAHIVQELTNWHAVFTGVGD
jgi:hypothetical protein